MRHSSFLFIYAFLCVTTAAYSQTRDDIKVVTSAGHDIYDFTVSPDGNYLLTTSSSSVALWNLRTMQIINILPGSVESASFGTGSPTIVYIKKTNKFLESYDILTGDFNDYSRETRFVKRRALMPKLKKTEKYTFELDKNTNVLRVYSKKSNKLLYNLSTSKHSSLGGIDVMKNDSLVLLTGMFPQIWNLKKARLENKIPFYEYVTRDSSLFFLYGHIPIKKKNIDLYRMRYYERTWCKGCFTNDGNIELGGYDNISTWSIKGNLLKEQDVGGNPVYSWIDYGGKRYVATLNNGLCYGGINEKYLNSCSLNTKMYFISDIMSDGKTYFSCNAGDYVTRGDITKLNSLHPSLWFDGHPFVNSCLTKDGSVILLSGEGGHLEEIDINNPGNNIKYKTGYIFKQSRVNGAVYINNDSQLVAACFDGVIGMWNRKEIHPIWSITPHKGQIVDVRPFHHHNWFITSGTDGWSKIFDWNSKKEVMAMYSADGTNDYIFLTPDNYYKGTKGIFNDIHFSKGLDTYDFEQFDLMFNRPDIVLERLGGDPNEINILHQAWLKRVKRMGFTPEQLSNDLHVPEAEIINLDELPAETSQYKIQLKLAATDKLYKIHKIMLYLNGVPLLGRHGLDVSQKKSRKYSLNYEMELASGTNDIVFSCINEKGVESFRQKVKINCTSKIEKRDLYIVSLGVSNYKESAYNLTYAEKDAKDFVKLMNNNLADKFDETHTLCLVNEQVMPKSIANIENFLKSAGRNDVVMVYYAGHGLLDKNLDYYLSNYTTNFENPQEGSLAYEKIEDCLDMTKSLYRCCFIDACHSGEIDKDDVLAESKVNIPEGNIKFRNAAKTQKQLRHGVKQINALMDDLFVETRWGIGATIMSSAGGLEAAVESGKWKNGLFTWCLIKGMEDPDADIDKDGKLTIGDLTEYVRREVSRLSGGIQQPMLRSGKSNMCNFVIR